MPDVPLRRAGSGASVWVVRTLLVLVIAGMGWTLLRNRINPKDVPAAELVTVPIAAAKINPGTKIETTHMKFLSLPKDPSLSEFILDSSLILGRVTTKEIAENKAFSDSNLAPKMADVPDVPKGWLGVTITHDKIDGQFGSMASGTIVSVFGVHAETGATMRVSRKAIAGGSGPGGMNLYMAPEDLPKFIQSQKLGKIMIVQGEDVSAFPVHEADPNRPIEIIRGTKRSVVSPGDEPEKKE